jgi:hypothetical protein
VVNKFQVPAVDEMPSDELIEFLHENQREWEGSGDGVVIEMLNGKRVLANPGDYIVRDEYHVYHVEKNG